MTFYNEFDRHKAAWLRELANSGEITNGDVDERSIKDLRADDVAGYNRAHFFAGIGVWDYAMRLAGWPVSWPVWSASCPCQPFSSAGRRKGTEDDRHLWPWLMGLIAERHPNVVIGEQVSSPDGLAWFDIVRTDLEAEGYACGSLDTCAAGIGAPHARQRLYWCALRLDGLADLPKQGLEEWRDRRSTAGSQRATAERGGGVDRLGHSAGRGCGERGDAALAGSCGYPDGAGCADGVGDNESERRCRGENDADGRGWERAPGLAGEVKRMDDAVPNGRQHHPEIGGKHGEGGGKRKRREFVSHRSLSDFTRGHWSGADWVLTRPQRVGDHPGLRPVEPGTFPLADGAPERVGRLRGYGDAIVATQAAAFIRCVMEEILERTR